MVGDKFSVFRYSGSILFIAAAHSMTLPITYIQLSDVLMVYYSNTVGYAAEECVAGQKMLEAGYKTSCVTVYEAYNWPGLADFEAKVCPNFLELLKSGMYNSFNDLLQIYDGPKKSGSNPPQEGTSNDVPVGTTPTVKAAQSLIPGTAFSRMHQVTEEEAKLIAIIKEIFASGKLFTVGIALAYLFIRLVGKSTEHVISAGGVLGTWATRYTLDMNSATSFKFEPTAIEALRVSTTFLASTVATFVLSLSEFMERPDVRQKILDRCRIQFKALTDIRLSFFGMVLPALNLSVADKMRISAEHLVYISMCDLTNSGCKVLLDFLSRLVSQPDKYKANRGLENAAKIDPKGAFRFCRLFNQQYMVNLSGIRHIHLTFLWMYIQKNLTVQTSAKDVKDSDRIFSRLAAVHMEFLAALGDLIIQYNGAEAGLMIVEDQDSEMAKIVKAKLMAKKKIEPEKFSNLVSARLERPPGEPTQPSGVLSVSLNDFKNFASRK